MFVHVCMYEHMHGMHACLHVFVYIYIYIYIYVLYVYTHTRMTKRVLAWHCPRLAL